MEIRRGIPADSPERTMAKFGISAEDWDSLSISSCRALCEASYIHDGMRGALIDAANSLAKAGMKIDSIKARRAATNENLRDAKAWVESITLPPPSERDIVDILQSIKDRISRLEQNANRER